MPIIYYAPSTNSSSIPVQFLNLSISQSAMAAPLARPLLWRQYFAHISPLSRPSVRVPRPRCLCAARPTSQSRSTPLFRPFSTSSALGATLNQVLRGCRGEQRARRRRSPQLRNKPEMKGVCIRVGTVKPKKPNSGERKVARIRLSNGREVTAYIPGEGVWVRGLDRLLPWNVSVVGNGGLTAGNMCADSIRGFLQVIMYNNIRWSW